MSHQVPWSKILLERFIEIGALTELEQSIMRLRVAGFSRLQICDKLCISLSTCDRAVKLLKAKYDKVQRYDPLLPPRKFSAKETWMDEH